MGLLPDPIGLMSTGDIQTLESIRLKGVILNIIQALSGNINTLYDGLWSNPQGLTPQQVMDAFGTDAGGLVNLFTEIVTFANGVSPGSIVLENPGLIVVNQDGTVTISGV